MDVSHILDPLNEPQREAVTSPADPILVLAGAGSGKTRVLVHRMAWLVQIENVSPYSILAVTFTNKAAAEMRTRTESLLHIPSSGMWVGTFHGIAHRLLRAHWQELDLPQTFQILDSEDQLRLIRRVLKALDLDEARWPAKQAMYFINNKKDEGLRPQHIQDNDDPHTRQMVRIYQTYEETCNRAGLVDFAELLLRAHELWLQHPKILEHYRNRFKHILVDEFQDTNTIQYAWLRVLAGTTGTPFVVGDDDQSIYGWRGAKIQNIQQFCTDFPTAKTIRLEQNYRSTGNILKAANALISNNPDRLGKDLWTNDEDGAPISLFSAFNEFEEASFVIDRIKDWTSQGNRHDEAAILYRSNAQSRLFEESLIQYGIPYRIYGGLRFFERQEIKDTLAYLRLIENRNDVAAFERVVNTPTRGIGNRSLDIIRLEAKQRNCSLWQATSHCIEDKILNARAANAVAAFIELINTLAESTERFELPEQVEHVIEISGLLQHYKKEKGEKGQTRIENLEELVNATRQFDPNLADNETETLSPLTAFLSHAALESGDTQADAWEDCVQLMTMHSAKGLEFPLVFIAGMEDGLFPHQMSIEDPDRLSEERRLCYVGMTRAKKALVLSYAEKRRLHGSESFPHPSRFLREIPKECLEEVRPKIKVSRPVYNHVNTTSRYNEPASSDLQLGKRVTHVKFGDGVVVNYEGNGAHARVQVNFSEVGSKWLVIAYANLQPI